MDFCSGCKIRDTQGTALLACLFALLLLTLLGSLALSNAQIEMRSALYQQQEVEALYLAEAGVHLMLYWLGRPESIPIPAQNLLMPRFSQNEGAPSFINEEGVSQFSGSPLAPDFQHSIPRDQGSWDASWISLWDNLIPNGETLSLKLYAPIIPGAIGTLESTAKMAAGVQKTVTVQLIQKGTRLLPMKGSWHEVYE
jgi:hypothetical protein